MTAGATNKRISYERVPSQPPSPDGCDGDHQRLLIESVTSTPLCIKAPHCSDGSTIIDLTDDSKAFNKASPTDSARSHRVLSFYQKQNSIIESLLEVDALHQGQYQDDAVDEAEEARNQRAIHMSFVANIILLFVRLGIAVISGSLSLIVTTLDAVLDVISGSIILTTSLSSKQPDKYKYPVGKSRMEPLGIVVFSTIMGTAGVSVIGEGVSDLMEGEQANMPHAQLVVAMSLVVVAVKGSMYVFCRSSRNSSVQAFAMDHLNDVLVNVVGLAGALMGKFLAPWLDPACAIAMSLWLIYAWGQQAYTHILNLVGLGASPEYLQKLTYLALHHDPAIQKLKTVRAYTFGDSWMVEVDVVLPVDIPFMQAHDIGHALQAKLERLPEVARAFVRLEYST